jgi:hypothetical protein
MHRDTQPNDIQHNDTQYNIKNTTLDINDTERKYTSFKCRYAECGLC